MITAVMHTNPSLIMLKGMECLTLFDHHAKMQGIYNETIYNVTTV